MQATLNASNFNGYNIACFGQQNGTLSVSVTGGTPPYRFEWSNGDSVATRNNLAAGYYFVRVTDSSSQVVEAFITLTQPEPLQAEKPEPFIYGNDYNISSFGACNGMAPVVVAGGVQPYACTWYPGNQTGLAPTNLCAGENYFTILDANGCKISNSIVLKQPERDDWTMFGNNGSNPADNFIGTADSNDFVFRTNNVERMRISSNGTVNIPTFSDSSFNLLGTDLEGNIVKVAPPISNPVIPYFPVWFTTGNNSNNTDFIGPLNNQDFIIKTGNQTWGTLAERVRVTNIGKVSIGVPANNLPGTYKLYVADGILTEKIKVALKTNIVDWADYVFDSDYKLMSLFELKKYIQKNKHLPDVPSAEQLIKEGGIDLGKTQAILLKKIEEQALYILMLNEEIEAIKAEVKKLSK